MNNGKIRKTYTEVRDNCVDRLRKLKRDQLLISLLRLAVFICGAGLTILVFSYSVITGIVVVLSAIVLFTLLVKKFITLSGEIRITENLIRINDNEIKALDGDYSPFDGANEKINGNHDFSGDIDLFGEESLFKYLNRTVTGPGKSILADWLSDPYVLKEKIPERQEAVRELADKVRWRQNFMARGFDGRLNETELNSLREWLNGKNYFLPQSLKILFAYFLPGFAITSLILVIAGIVPFILFLTVYFINIFLIGILLRKINKVHAMVSRKHQFLSSAGQLINEVEKEEFKAAALVAIKEKIVSGEGSVATRIRKLDNIVQLFDSRLNLFVGFLLNGLLLWDIQCIILLEKWKDSAAKDLPLWLNLLGEIDALNSLANYAYNNEGFCYPELSEDGHIIDALGLGHPLLRPDERINNNFTIPRHGLIFIVTGANMAGKSTFLRTVAVNIILAMTGAPVCAEKMNFIPVKLFSSMRTTDSLSHNESYFYAELKRLKVLKERLERKDNVFFILDEILKGTNSTDKSLGSKMFLRQLVRLGATGLIATHDTLLGELENEYPGIIVNKCFEIEIDGENISFDYILRDGITRKMNAAVLMKQMGIT